jgi:hypothetical protein
MTNTKVIGNVINYLTISIATALVIGSIFILMSHKPPSYLETPLLSNNAKFVIGAFLVLMALVFALAAYLKGVLF